MFNLHLVIDSRLTLQIFDNLAIVRQYLCAIMEPRHDPGDYERGISRGSSRTCTRCTTEEVLTDIWLSSDPSLPLCHASIIGLLSLTAALICT